MGQYGLHNLSRISFVCLGKRRGGGGCGIALEVRGYRGRGKASLNIGGLEAGEGGGLGRGIGYDLYKCLGTKVRH